MSNAAETPSGRRLFASGELEKRAERARRLLADCRLCPRRCRVDRLAGETGVCGIAGKAVVASYSPHFGEEEPLVGQRGSGTIFLSGCNLRCSFCQNYDISHDPDAGLAVDERQFAAIILDLQSRGCHNINFVTPTHVVPQILGALAAAYENGLELPLVYNSSGYETIETLELLDGVFDIYMPDFKFWKPASADRYARAPDYPEAARTAVAEMFRQVGDLDIGAEAIARRGLLVRHLLMPDALDETEAILNFIAASISPATYVNIMDQYRPCGRAGQHPELQAGISPDHYRRATALAEKAGLTRLDERSLGRLLRHLKLI